MEHKIGEIITLPDGRKAEVVETEASCICSECAMWLVVGCGSIYACDKWHRTDHKNIIYKEIKED